MNGHPVYLLISDLQFQTLQIDSKNPDLQFLSLRIQQSTSKKREQVFAEQSNGDTKSLNNRKGLIPKGLITPSQWNLHSVRGLGALHDTRLPDDYSQIFRLYAFGP